MYPHGNQAVTCTITFENGDLVPWDHEYGLSGLQMGLTMK